MEAPPTRRALERVPENKLDWKPHERSLSMGQLAMHVANIPGVLSEISLMPSFDVSTVIPRPSAASIAKLLTTFDESVAKARILSRTMDGAALATPWRMFNGNLELALMPRSIFCGRFCSITGTIIAGSSRCTCARRARRFRAIYGASADEVPGVG